MKFNVGWYYSMVALLELGTKEIQGRERDGLTI